MTLRCSPFGRLIYLIFAGVFIFFAHAANAQCKGEFSFQSFSSQKESTSGKIEISIKDPEPGTYSFKVFKMEGKASLVQSGEALSPDKITIEGLMPSTYFVKIEWGSGCSRVLGGIDGISITPKEQTR